MIKKKDLLFILLLFLLVTIINVFCLHGFTINGVMQSGSVISIGIYMSILFIVYKINDRYLNPVYRYMAVGMCLIQILSNSYVARIVFNNLVENSIIELTKALLVSSILEIIFFFFLFYFYKKNYSFIELFVISLCLISFGVILISLPNKGIVFYFLKRPPTIGKRILYKVFALANLILLFKTKMIKDEIKEKSLRKMKIYFIFKVLLFLSLDFNTFGVLFVLKFICKMVPDIIVLYLIFTEAVEKPNYKIICDLDESKAYYKTIKEYNELVFKKIPFGVLVVDNNNKTLEFNNGLRQMFGINNIEKLSDFLDKRSLEHIENIRSNDNAIITDIETVVDNVKKVI